MSSLWIPATPHYYVGIIKMETRGQSFIFVLREVTKGPILLVCFATGKSILISVSKTQSTRSHGNMEMGHVWQQWHLVNHNPLLELHPLSWVHADLYKWYCWYRSKQTNWWIHQLPPKRPPEAKTAPQCVAFWYCCMAAWGARIGLQVINSGTTLREWINQGNSLWKFIFCTTALPPFLITLCSSNMIFYACL